MILKRLSVLTAVLAIAGGWTQMSMAASEELIAKAQEEGRLVFFTTRQIDAMNALVSGFEAKYGITVEASRHNNESLIQKIVNESAAGQPTADVFDGSSGMIALRNAGLVEHYVPEEAANFPDEYKDPEGYWTAANVFVTGLAYNTDLVPPEDAPRTLEDLLDPRFAGRQIAYSTQYTVAGIMGLIAALEKTRGPEATRAFLEQLREQNTVGLDTSPAGVLDGVLAGQYAVCIGCQNMHVARAQENGAPVAFSTDVQPVVSFFSVMGLVKNQAHPNAARLFVEYVLSEEGQRVVEDSYYIAARPGIEGQFDALKPGPDSFAAEAIPPTLVESDMGHWEEVYGATLR